MCFFLPLAASCQAREPSAGDITELNRQIKGLTEKMDSLTARMDSLEQKLAEARKNRENKEAQR